MTAQIIGLAVGALAGVTFGLGIVHAPGSKDLRGIFLLLASIWLMLCLIGMSLDRLVKAIPPS